MQLAYVRKKKSCKPCVPVKRYGRCLFSADSMPSEKKSDDKNSDVKSKQLDDPIIAGRCREISLDRFVGKRIIVTLQISQTTKHLFERQHAKKEATQGKVVHFRSKILLQRIIILGSNSAPFETASTDHE